MPILSRRKPARPSRRKRADAARLRVLGFDRKLRAPGVLRWRGRFVSRFGFPSGGSFARAVAGGDRGSSGLLTPGGLLVRRLCHGLPVPRAGWLDDCGSSGADRERFEIRSFDACRRPLMWLVEEWTRHESGTSVLVEPLS